MPQAFSRPDEIEKQRKIYEEVRVVLHDSCFTVWIDDKWSIYEECNGWFNCTADILEAVERCLIYRHRFSGEKK